MEARYISASAPNSKYLTTINPDFTLPADFDDFVENYHSRLQFVYPPRKPVIGLHDGMATLPNLDNSTGRINFYSPFWDMRPGEYFDGSVYKDEYPARFSPDLFRVLQTDYAAPHYRAGWRTPTARYIPTPEGYEKFFSDPDLKNFTGYTSPVSNRKYTLLYMTNKARNRAHSVFDNVAVIKEQFTQTVKMNTMDAEARGIKNGDLVYVYNDRGCTKIPAEVSHTMIPGLISVEHGGWYKPSSDPDEVVTIWMDSEETGIFVPVAMPVDLCGAENILTDDNFILDPVFCPQTLAAQGGPCEVSLERP
jgi:anaerobic dimethyl sulfoxide reductase subunit A